MLHSGLFCVCIFGLLAVLCRLSIQVIDWRDSIVSEMTYNVLKGTILTHSLPKRSLYRTEDSLLRLAGGPAKSDILCIRLGL